MERVVVITGAGGRLGLRMVEGFRKYGYKVVTIGRDVADLTREAEVVEAFRSIGERHGTLFALVHTVGTWQIKSLSEMSLTEWDQMMNVNLGSTFLCFREAARLMDGGVGRLVAITSVQGTDRGRAGQAHYAASKAGIVRLVESAALEYQKQGITVHALAPGTIVFDGKATTGVPAEDIVEAALYLCGPSGKSMSGSSVAMYGVG